MTLEELLQSIAKLFPSARVSSTKRPGAITRSGKPSLHSVNRAADIAGSKSVMKSIFDWAVKNAESIGAQEIIYQNQIWKKDQGLSIWPYADHKDHVHIGLLEDNSTDSTTNSNASINQNTSQSQNQIQISGIRQRLTDPKFKQLLIFGTAGLLILIAITRKK